MKKLATVRTPVLLIGENGTGKGSVGEILHGATGAPESAFVRVDCSLCSEANFREGLLGQNGDGGAWVKQAKGGTLFLQHLQCLTQSVQKELVSVLRSTAYGFRLICTTSEDLEKLVDEGKFHDELFYRVASLPVQMPPLHSRAEDIPLLVKHFATQAANPLFEGNLIEFTDDALAVMPEGTAINFLSGRRNPLREEIITPGYLDGRGEERAIRQLREAGTALILVPNRPTAEFGPAVFGRDYSQRMMGWIEANYVTCAIFGPVKDPGLEIGDRAYFIRAYCPRGRAEGQP